MTAASHLSEPAGDFQALHEFVEAAKDRLPGDIWDYLTGAAETETTMRRNRQALDSLAFRPRVLRDVSAIDSTHTILGRKSRLPIFLAPVGGLESIHPGGAAEVARGAARFGVPVMVSSVTGPDPAVTAAASGDGHRMFQLYVRGGDDFVDEQVHRALANGFDAFCITVDTQAYSRRERDITRRFVKPWRRTAAGHNYQASFDWAKVERFKAVHKVPLILKGIATAEDASMACERGVDVIYVSNHGGRQLDHGRGSMDVLPEILEAVRGRARIFIDGGFSRGTDILKALAMGADAVGIGRLYCYGLAAGGADTLVQLFEVLEHEVAVSLALLGCVRCADLTRAHLHPVPTTHLSPTASSFPLLDIYREFRS